MNDPDQFFNIQFFKQHLYFIKDQLRKCEAERVIRFFKDRPRLWESVGKSFAHANDLRSLSREQ